MKKNLFTKLIFLTSLLSFTTLFVGCQDEEKEKVKEEKKYAYVTPSSLNFSAESGSQTVSLNTNTTVWIYSPSTWVKGTVNAQSCEIIVQANTSKNSRSAVLEVKGNGIDSPQKINVTQTGKTQSGGNDNDDSSLSAPQNVSAQNTGTSSSPQVRVSWSSVSGATGYRLYRSSSANGSYAQLSSSSSTYIMDNSPMKGSNYYKVKAYNSKGESDYSSYAVFQNNAVTELDAPTNVRAVQSGADIFLSWNPVAGAAKYQAHYTTPDGSSDFVNVTSTTYTFVWRNPVSGIYKFYVTALDKDYNIGKPSVTVSCNYTANGGGGGGGDTPKQLETPKNLEAYGNSYDSYVQISFDPVPLAYSYELYRSTSPYSSYKKVTATGGSSGSRYILTDQNPLSGTSYYKVKAIALSSTGIKDSELSDYVKVTR